MLSVKCHFESTNLYVDVCETVLVDEFKPLWNKEGHKLAFGSTSNSLWKQYPLFVVKTRQFYDSIHISHRK